MYTFIHKPEAIDHRPGSGEPTPQIIDHHESRKKTPKWKVKHKKDDLPYEVLKEQINTLLTSEFKYKRRIQELEKESKELVQTYEKTYQENKVLKSIVEHGADAVKVKRLTKQNKEQQIALQELKKQNNDLLEQLKNYQQSNIKLSDSAQEINSKDAIAIVNFQGDEKSLIPTPGSFLGTKLKSKKRLAINGNGEVESDEYDLQLDNIEKETLILANKIRQLQREKGHIDWANLMGKGAITKNVTIGHAIKEKLNRDLNKFAIRLEKLKLKHNAIKDIQEMAKNELQHETHDNIYDGSENDKAETWERKRDEIMENTKQNKGHHLSAKYTTYRRGKKRSPQFLASDLPAEESSPILVSNTNPSHQANEAVRTTNETQGELLTKIKVSDYKDYKLAKAKTVVSANSKQSTNTNQELFQGPFNEHKSNNYKQIDEIKQVHTKIPLSLTEENKSKVRKQSINTDDEVTGRYNHGPEPIASRIKNDLRFKSKIKSPHIAPTRVMQFTPMVAKTTIKTSTVDQSNRKQSETNLYDVVLADLKKQNRENESEFNMKSSSAVQNNLQSYDKHKNENKHIILQQETQNEQLPTIPISFKSESRSVYNREVRQIVGNNGLRFL